MKPGGTKGGEQIFIWGLGIFLLGFGAYLFLDSIKVIAGERGGAISGMLGRRGRGGGGMAGTVSNMLIFTPFVLGVVILFFDATKKWAWWLMGAGVVFIIIEVISRTRFMVNLKGSHMLLLLFMMASGAGLILRSYMQTRKMDKEEEKALEKREKNSIEERLKERKQVKKD